MAAGSAVACPTADEFQSGLRVSFDTGAFVEARPADGGAEITVYFPITDFTVRGFFAKGIYAMSIDFATLEGSVTWDYAPDHVTAPEPGDGVIWETDVTQRGGAAPNTTERSVYAWRAPEAPLAITSCLYDHVLLTQSTTLHGRPHVTHYAYLVDFGFLLMLEQFYGGEVRFEGVPVSIEVLQ